MRVLRKGGPIRTVRNTCTLCGSPALKRELRAAKGQGRV